MIIYEAPTITIEYNKEKCQIIQRWKGFSTSDVFRTAIMKTSEFAQANNVTSLISDTTEQSVVKPEDVQFAASRMPKNGIASIKAIAFIMPKNLFAQMSLKRLDKESHSELLSFFDSYETAQKWIDSKVQ